MVKPIIKDGVEAHSDNMRDIMLCSSKVALYHHRTQPKHVIQWRVKMGEPGSMVGISQSIETTIVQSAFVSNGINEASGRSG